MNEYLQIVKVCFPFIFLVLMSTKLAKCKLFTVHLRYLLRIQSNKNTFQLTVR